MSKVLPYSMQDVDYDNAKFRPRSSLQVMSQKLVSKGIKHSCTRCSTGKLLLLLMVCGLTCLVMTHKSSDILATGGQGVQAKSGGSKLGRIWRKPPRLPPQLPPDEHLNKKTVPGASMSNSSAVRAFRQEMVKKAFVHAWSGYRNYAMGYDELMPLSKRGIDGLGGLGATIVDSLDTAMIMGLDEIVSDAGAWIESHLSERINEKGQVNLFETTIRVLGGLLSAYHLRGGDHITTADLGFPLSVEGPKPEVYLEVARNLADRLLSAFTSSPTPIPFSDVTLRDRTAHPAPDGLSSTSEVSSIQLEFNYLSAISGDPKYESEAMKVLEHFKTLPKVEGLVPIFIRIMSGSGKSHTPEDPGWAHITLVDVKKRKVKCNYCGKEMFGGITRGKQHLGGVKGDVAQCNTAPRAVREEMRKMLLQKKQIKETKADDEEEIAEEISGRLNRRTMRDDVDESGSEDSDPELTEQVERERVTRSKGKEPLHGTTARRAGPMDTYLLKKESVKQPKIKQAMKGVKKGAESAAHAFKSICKWFFHAGVPAHAAQSEYFQPMIDAVAEVGPGYKVPTRRDIYTRGLDGEMEELNAWVETFKPIWRERGCTIMCDGWTGTTKKSMINFLVYSIEGTVFLKSVDASNYEKNANFLFRLMDDMVAEIGEMNVVQIVTDNEASYKAAGKLLMKRRQHLYWLPCAAHCLDLILEDIRKDKNVKVTVGKAQAITRYIYGHPRILNMFRENATAGRDIIRAGPTRFASNFISLESLQKFKNDLKAFMYNPKFRAYVDSQDADGQCDYIDCCYTVEDKIFWERVQRYLKVVSPLVKVLRMVDGDDKNDMGYLYECMDRAKLEIRAALPREYTRWWTIIDKRWENTLHHDMHAAGYFFNPRLIYGDTAHVDREVLQGTLNVIGRLAMNEDSRMKAELEMDPYRMKTGTYANSQVQYAVGKVTPAEWWIMVNNRDLGTNDLAVIAIRVLSQTTSASQCERNWSTFSLIHSKVRNRLKAERLEKLVYCHYNMRLRIKNMRLRQQLRAKRQDDDALDEIDVDALFDDDNPMQSWVEVREQVDEPVFNEEERTWAEGILDEDEPRDPEFKRPGKRTRGESSGKGNMPEVSQPDIEIEPGRFSESDSRPVTPRMVKPPPSLTRSTSVVERVAEKARNDPAIEKLKNIYVRRRQGDSQSQKKKKELSQKTKEKEKKKTKAQKSTPLVIYTSSSDDDDDPSAASGAGENVGGGTYSQAQGGYEGEAQDPYGTYSQSPGEFGGEAQGHYGGYGGGQQDAGMYGWTADSEFQFQPSQGSNSFGESSSYSGFQPSQQPNTPRGIQSGMYELGASLFGYSGYAEYMHPTYGYPTQDDKNEGEGSSGFWGQ